MLNQAKYSRSSEKQRETSEYLDIDIKGYKFIWTNLYKSELAHGEYIIKKISWDYDGYKWEVIRNGKIQDKFYNITNAKKYIVKEIQELLD